VFSPFKPSVNANSQANADKEWLGFLAQNGMSYSGMEYLPDEISLDKREPTSRT
jgi:hypothetical protein